MSEQWTKYREYASDEAQHKLLDLLEQGLSHTQIAQQLGIGRSSVHTRMRTLRRRFAGAESPAPVLPKHHTLRGISSYYNHEKGKVTGQWIKTRRSDVVDGLRWEAIKSEMQQVTEPLPATARPLLPDADADLCNVYIFGDPHIGMLAYNRETGDGDWDLAIAERVMVEALRRVQLRAPRAKRALFVNIGDFFHHENDRQSTPKSGHKLDGDSRFVKVAETGCRIHRTCTSQLYATHEELTVANVPGNHDPDGGRWLNLWCKEAYRDLNIDVLDNANPYMYFRFVQNLLGLHHGDGASRKKLASIMPRDRRADWGSVKHARWICGHWHTHEVVPDSNCPIEYFPTLAPRDYYSQHGGWRSERALHCLTLHKDYGIVNRCQVTAEEAQEAL